MTQALSEFFNSENFMPHGHCFLWQRDILWLHVFSDAGIVAAYFAIPFVLLYFIWKRKDLPFQRVFLLFGAFILLCGMTHFMGIWVLWHPDYAIEGVLKALTAIVSIATFFVVVKLIPQMLMLPSPSQLARVNQELRDANDKLALLYEQAKERTQSHLRAVVDHALDGLISINESGSIESFNPACERIFGYKVAEVIGQNIKMLMPEPYHDEHDHYLSHYRQTGEARIIGTTGREVRAKRKDGSVFPMDLSISVFQLEDGRHFSGIIRDITARKMAELEIQENQERYQALVESSSQIVWRWKEGVIDEASPLSHWWESTTGQPAATIATFGWLDVVHPDDRDQMKEIWEAAIAERKKFELNYRLRGKNGNYLHVEVRGVPVISADGSVREFVGSLNDVTARKMAEEKNALLAAVVASSDDAIISKKLDGTIVSWNTGAEKLLGYSSSEIIGKHISVLIPEHLLKEEEYIIGQVHQGVSINHYETVRRHKNGQLLDLSLTVSPIFDDKRQIVGASKIARDISYRKATELKLQRYTSALERSNKELDDFAYIASHDLKEPLRGLINNARFLEKDYKDKLDTEGVGRLQRLGYLTQRMETLINDLLYFSRLGRQDLAIIPTNLNVVIHDIEFMMETTLKEENATICIPHPLPEIICDKTRVTEIFRNLITNAVKYNEQENKSIEIGYLDEIKTKNGIENQVFYVRDNGIGIGEEFHEDIFRIFKRLNEEEDDKKGTGVGLTFVRKIVERHGGRIWLESVLGKGTTFYFTLTKGIEYAAAA